MRQDWSARVAKLGYATVGSNDLVRAKSFYDDLLKVADIKPMFEHPSGGRVYGVDGELAFGVLGPFNKEPATVGNGTMVAFCFNDPHEVDAFHAKALELGGTDEGAPGERGPAMYFSYFRDLDGNKLCAYCTRSRGSDA
jgi:catechol 2,3-dioxygenase-like lactoylglutathione lyase family enzyme